MNGNFPNEEGQLIDLIGVTPSKLHLKKDNERESQTYGFGRRLTNSLDDIILGLSFSVSGILFLPHITTI